MTTAEPRLSPTWLPVGEEPHPPGSITHLVVLRSDEHSLVTLPSGQIEVGVDPAAGLYHRDTRHLSRLRLSFGGVEPVILDAGETEHGLSAIACNPPLRDPAGEVIAGQTLTVRRRRVLVDALFESIAVSNYGARPVAVDVRLDYDADFADIFEVRGYERLSPPGTRRVERSHTAVRYRYRGADGEERTTLIQFAMPPTALDDTSATYRLELDPRETTTIEFEVCTGATAGQRRFALVLDEVRQRQRAWLESMTGIETDDQRVNALLHRSLLDVEALRGTHQGLHYLAAGVPWFDTLFGRDSLISGMMLLPFRPELLASALDLLSAYQSTEAHPERDAEPGKIAHELRWGELANLGEVPFGRYYGSVDATPLFIVAAHEYFRWTNDRERLRELWPHLQAAYAWCRGQAAGGPGGFLAYARETAAGLENQGWKDSHDAIVWPDGTLVRPPIALVEVQAYLLAAMRAYLAIAAALGETVDEAGRAAPEAFAARFHEAFAHPELGYVLALDGEAQPVPTAASNAGHALWAGAAQPASAAQVAESLLSHDMFSGWGVRTLASSTAGFNPVGYHTGSVWPHDNALSLAGLRRYGFDDDALELGDAMLEAAMLFPHFRVPELFSGDNREYRAVPTPYPVASRPQAWSAAAIPYLLISMLGIVPAGPGRIAIVRPILPRMLNRVSVRQMRVGYGTVDLTFHRSGDGVGVEVGRMSGDIEVTFGTTSPDAG